MIITTPREGGAVLLHDRSVPGTRGNIDHLVVAVVGCGWWTQKTTRAASRGVTVEGGPHPIRG